MVMILMVIIMTGGGPRGIAAVWQQRGLRKGRVGTAAKSNLLFETAGARFGMSF